MTAIETGLRPTAGNDAEQMRQALAVAEQRVELYDNALYIAHRVCDHLAELPMSSLGIGEAMHAVAVTHEEVLAAAREFAVRVGYLAKHYSDQSCQLREALRHTGRR